MKKIILSTIIMGTATMAQAQDTYLNDRLTNNAGDVYGTARFVGMGGAMGALGADISTIDWNPAGIGMMRKSDLSFTAGAVWDKVGVNGLAKAHATLDQMGGVYAIPLSGNSKVQYVNIAFNYQKKKNFNNAFIADNDLLKGWSQMDQVCDLLNAYGTTDDDGYVYRNLAGLAGEFYNDKTGYSFLKYDETTKKFTNQFSGERNRYTQKTWGSQNAFDFNISTNINDRAYLGLTLGFDNIRYRAWYDLYEENTNPSTGGHGDYTLYNDHAIDGFGFNLKLGTIVRPIEDNPFRIAFTLETPTWYHLKSSTYYQLTDEVEKVKSDMPESYLEYSLRTPLKVRLSIGSTVSNFLAWDVDYEYALYNKAKMGYPNDAINTPQSSIFSNTWDDDMNLQTENNMKGTHNVRAGVEYKPTSNWAFRLGYNYATSAYKKNVTFDQYALNSYAMNYATTTSYMRLGDVNCLTLGLGYRWKHAYIDLGYKLINQKGDFYAFYAPSDANIGHSPNELTPVGVDLTKQQVTATFGVRF